MEATSSHDQPACELTLIEGMEVQLLPAGRRDPWSPKSACMYIEREAIGYTAT